MPLIHTCYRITDIDRSIAFYNALGFEEVGRIPIGDEAINVFMNQPGDGDMPRLELTYNFGVDSYDIGTGYGHIAITSSDLDGTLARLAAQGIQPEKPPLLGARGRLAALLCERPRRVSHRDHRAGVGRRRDLRTRFPTTSSRVGVTEARFQREGVPYEHLRDPPPQRVALTGGPASGGSAFRAGWRRGDVRRHPLDSQLRVG